MNRATSVRTACAAAIAAGSLGMAPAAGEADSFTPIRLTVRIAPVARLGQPLPITVGVNADPSVLDDHSGALRVRVKLTRTECGGDYATTSGVVLLDRALKPQPDPGEAYSAHVTGQGRPTSYGNQILCIYLMDDYKQFDTDTDRAVNVSRACTSTAAAYDRDVRAHRRAAAARDRRRARKACGKGVAL